MTSVPTVSVVMPAFNAAKFLDEAVCAAHNPLLTGAPSNAAGDF